MEVGSFCTKERVALVRMLCFVMEASVVETVLVAEKFVIWLLLEMGMLLKDMDALQKDANINEKVVTTMVGRVKPEVGLENKDYDDYYSDDDGGGDYYNDGDGGYYDDDGGGDEGDGDDQVVDGGDDYGDDQDVDGGEDDLSGGDGNGGDDDNDDDDDDDPNENGEGGSEEEDDDNGDDDGEDEDEDEDKDEETPQPPSKEMVEEKYYVVFEGRTPGLYNSWEDCSLQVLGYPRNIYRSFSTREEAASAFKRYEHKKFQCNSGQEGACTTPIREESSQVGSTSINKEIKKANSSEEEQTQKLQRKMKAMTILV